jgi:hypothetical protein
MRELIPFINALFCWTKQEKRDIIRKMAIWKMEKAAAEHAVSKMKRPLWRKETRHNAENTKHS